MPAKRTATKTAKKTATPPRATSKPSAKKTTGTTSPKSKNQAEKKPKIKKPRTAKPSTVKASGSKVRNSSSFAKAESKAKEYAKDPKKLHKLFEDAAEKSKEAPKGPFGETWAYLQAMIRLIRAYAKGTYREIPLGSLLMILVAVIYFVSPFDVIPDFVQPVVGYLDDAFVVSLALKQVKSDLDAFMVWEMESA